MTNTLDVLIIGAGAAGLMCGIQAGARGKQVLVLDKSNKVGKKILMSGGGRCNFTNVYTSPEQFISQNEHFCKSALSRFTPSDFIQMVERYRIDYYEKTLGQLFCKEKSHLIVEMLLAECKQHRVEIQLNQHITAIQKDHEHFMVHTNHKIYRCRSLVVATGGLSIPTLGSSPFGYQ
ncbi:MAG: aminoacetone oxidase family FAD-binding enzyme, partial [Methylococcales bacterium]|nr:aminoacetone oxidase family FAD-binding enzyme [Methylococcales bacterium]